MCINMRVGRCVRVCVHIRASTHACTCAYCPPISTYSADSRRRRASVSEPAREPIFGAYPPRRSSAEEGTNVLSRPAEEEGPPTFRPSRLLEIEKLATGSIAARVDSSRPVVVEVLGGGGMLDITSSQDVANSGTPGDWRKL